MEDKSYIIVRTKEQLIELHQHILNSDIIAYDIETTSLNPRTGTIIGFSVSGDIGVGYYLPTWVWNVESQKLDPIYYNGTTLGDDIAKKLISILQTKRLVMHNGSFDIRYTKNYYGIDLRDALYCDTMLLRHTLVEDGPFGLKDIAIELQQELGIDAQKEANEEQVLMKESIKKNGGQTTKENFEIYKADMQLLGNYAAADTDLTLRVMTHYLPILKQEGLWDFFFVDEVMPLYKTVTIQMEEVGTKLDMKLINKTKEAIIVDIARLEQEITSELISIPQVKEWIMVKATKAFPPKKRGRFGDKLRDITPFSIQGVNDFMESGDPNDLDPKDAMKVSLELWKEKEGNYLNISSKQQLGDIVFKYMNIKPLSQTRKGTYQFDDDMIEHLSKTYTWAAKLRDYNKLNKINSAYIDRFLENNEDGVYYHYVKQHGTTSGRFSSDCQQMPRVLEEGEASELVLQYNNKIRAFLIPGKGRKYVICDQSSLEPRVFASVSNDPNLINVFLNDEDLYSRVAIQAFKLKGMSANKKDDNYVKKVKPELRQKAKSIALAIPYGAGAWQISQNLGIHLKEAQKLIDGYLDGFPELARWMSDTHHKVHTIGIIKNKTGRIRHLERVKAIYDKFQETLMDPKSFKTMKGMCKTPEQTQKLLQLRMEYKNGLNNSKNFQIQSLAASIMNRSAIAIHKEFKEKNLDAYIELQIHDEFVINCKTNIAKEVSDIVKYHMENTLQIPTGLVAEPNITNNFSEGHI
jgi:DNA polymerase I-like protein with 3'-5' exonuclease and polymerase domains